MLSSLKKWVQDVAIDLTPPPPPPPPLLLPQPSSSSTSFLSSSSIPGSANHYYYPTTSSHEKQQFNQRLSTNSSPSVMGLSRPISMDSVRSSRSSKMATISVQPPASVSPVELDLSHLNREEQAHIANVLRRARAVDEQQSPLPPVVIPTIISPQASILSTSLSPSASSSSSSSSSSTSTSSFNSEQQGQDELNDRNDNNDDIKIREDEEALSPPESTLITIHRCQVCNKEQQQQQGNTTICLQCQNDEEVTRVTENNTTLLTSTENSSSSSSPIPIGFNDDEEDKISDNVMKIDQEAIKRNSPIQESTSHQYTEEMNDNQGQENADEEKQLRQSSTSASLLMQTRSNNLTEIDEDDFFYQGPSPYETSIDTNLIPEKIDEQSIPSYKIDEYIDEDDNDERDHVKELEETIANLTRHFPSSSEQIDDMENNPIVKNLRQPSTLSVGKIDIDSILEMEIESPSTDEHYLQSSSSMYPSSSSSQHPPNVPISVPITISNRRGSLSRSSGVRDHLTDLLITTATAAESYHSDNLPLQRTASTHSKRVIPMHRQKRNLPSVPTLMNHLQLRRANSESRFSLPAVPPSIQLPNSNIDDESDLLEIDLNDPTGSMNRTPRSKTESELTNSNDRNSDLKTFHTTNQSPSINELSPSKKPIIQVRDQTTNTPPISSLSSTNKIKKKLKKKSPPSPNHMNGHHTNSTYINDQVTSPTRTSPPSVLIPSITTNNNRPKLQKSTSTETTYPFPVSKLILSHDNLNPSRQDGADLGLRITGGHSIPNCMEVTACIEHIDTHHRNYNILKNAVQEGDEVLEVGGVSLRGKSALFVENLINSIQNEFEIVVRSQLISPPISPPVEIHKPENNHSDCQSQNNLTVSYNSSLTVDPNIHRRHSMDISQFTPTNTVVKSQSTIMSLLVDDSSNVSDQYLSPTINRKKSVSSKERLFSIESLHRSSSTKSIDHLIKVATTTQSSDTKIPDIQTNDLPEHDRKHALKKTPSLVKQISLAVTTDDNKMSNEQSTDLSRPLSRPRLYEHRKSLLPNDRGLNGAGSNLNVDRRNSNESDESDNLSQYFRSPQSRKSSLMTTNDTSNVAHADLSLERTESVLPVVDDDDVAINASRRLQSFLQSSDEKRRSRGSTGGDSIHFVQTEERKSSSALASLKFFKKKTKSVDFLNQPAEVRENDYVGDIELQIGHTSEREQLLVRIIKAKNLLAKDTNGFSDPFVKVYLLPGRDQENKRRTKHISKNLNPVWDHTVIYGNMHREELQYKMLEFTVWDYDRFKANDFLGQVTIDLKEGNVIDDKPHWYRLQALRSREEATNRGSLPGLFKMTSVESPAPPPLALNKTTVNAQSRGNQRK